MTDHELLQPAAMSGESWSAATDRVAADLGLSLNRLSPLIGYASPKAIYASRRNGAPAYMVLALRAVAANAPRLPEEPAA